MANHRWGINWLRYHGDDRRDFDHIARMGYKSIKVFEWMWNNPHFCRDLVAACPADTIFIARDIPLSHQHDDIRRDPAAAGRDHAQQWLNKIKEGRFHLPLDRTYFQGVNEFDESNLEAQFNVYSEEYIVALGREEKRAAAWVFGTGHPSTIGRLPHTLPDWSWYNSSANALIEHDGIANLHEYGVPGNLQWGFHVGRSIYCPYPVTVVYDEFGIDLGTVEHGNLQGYLHFVGDGKPFQHPEDYLPWLDDAQYTLLHGLKKHGCPIKVHSLQLFCYDTDGSWKTFNTLPVAKAMESFPWTPVEQSKPVPPPSPPGSHALHIPYVVSTAPPSRDAARDNFDAAVQFVLDWEGGFVNHPRDPGGATKFGITFATFQRWRAYQGMPTPTVDDLKAMQGDEARAIYRKFYWDESGSDKLPWPYCLVHFDAYVQNPAAAAKFRQEHPEDALRYLVMRLRWYRKLPEFPTFGAGWTGRVLDLMDIVLDAHTVAP